MHFIRGLGIGTVAVMFFCLAGCSPKAKTPSLTLTRLPSNQSDSILYGGHTDSWSWKRTGHDAITVHIRYLSSPEGGYFDVPLGPTETEGTLSFWFMPSPLPTDPRKIKCQAVIMGPGGGTHSFGSEFSPLSALPSGCNALTCVPFSPSVESGKETEIWNVHYSASPTQINPNPPAPALTEESIVVSFTPTPATP